jgi:hypothetical protein
LIISQGQLIQKAAKVEKKNRSQKTGYVYAKQTFVTTTKCLICLRMENNGIPPALQLARKK